MGGGIWTAIYTIEITAVDSAQVPWWDMSTQRGIWAHYQCASVSFRRFLQRDMRNIRIWDITGKG
jgi:hypothetical protein